MSVDKPCGATMAWEGHNLVCDRIGGHTMLDHHTGLPAGNWLQHVWWVDGKVTTVTDSVGVAVSLLPPPEPTPVPIDAKGYKTRNTKQRRTDRPMVPVSISSGKGRHWYKTT